MPKSNRPFLPAKLTRPQAHGLLPRERLFRDLDDPRRRWTWIGAPAGTGKTTLASSWIQTRRRVCLWYRLDGGDADAATLFHYLALAGVHRAGRRYVHLPPLTPEFLPGIEVYARRFFEHLFALYTRPFVIVFDNCQELGGAAVFADMIVRTLLECLPAHGHLLCLSRAAMPTALVRWSTDPGFAAIDWERLRFTDEEAIELAAGRNAVDTHAVTACNQQVRGWVTGLKLLLRRGHAEPDVLLPEDGLQRQAVFDYFAQEVFRGVDDRTRELLLSGSVLEEMDAETLAALTQTGEAETTLAALYGQRLFIERRNLPTGLSYHLHPLFRDFLRAQLTRSRETAFDELSTRAALILESRGRLEAATQLALQSADAALLGRLILRQAPLLMSQGRWITLEQYLSAVPESRRDAEGWLLYWTGLSRSMRDPPAGRDSLERSYERFRHSGDVTGTWLAVASLVQSQFLDWGAMPAELQRWLRTLEGLFEDNGRSIPAAVEPALFTLLQSMSGHAPEHPLARHLVTRARLLAPGLTDRDQRFAIGAIAVGSLTWQGDERSAWRLLEQLEARQSAEDSVTAASLQVELWRGILLWTGSEHERCVELLEAARARCREAGLGVLEYLFNFHLALCALSAGDASLAGELVRTTLQSLRAPQVTVLRLLKALDAMRLGLAGQGAAAGAMARELLAEEGVGDAPTSAAMERILLAVALLEGGLPELGTSCALQALQLAQRLPSDRWMFEAHMLLAAIELERGAQEPARDQLNAALSLAAERDFGGGVSLFQTWRAAALLGFALRHDIHSQYARRLIRRRRLPPPPDIVLGAVWPVRLRIQALGKFSVLVDERPLQGAAPAMRRPLELLKALIGLGTHVSVASLTAALWPELDGDAAQNTCHVTVHRLRKLLGDDSLIRMGAGTISLNTQDAWVDVIAFEELFVRIRTTLSGASRTAGQLESLAAELSAGYPGHFLPGEEPAWALGLRERLRERFIYCVQRLTAGLEQVGALQAAIEINQYGIERDPLIEEFHRGLLRALLAQGQKAEAIRAFERCRRLLKVGLDIAPSAQTLQLYARIRQC